jgi:hypothetical protein
MKLKQAITERYKELIKGTEVQEDEFISNGLVDIINELNKYKGKKTFSPQELSMMFINDRKGIVVMYYLQKMNLGKIDYRGDFITITLNKRELSKIERGNYES